MSSEEIADVAARLEALDVTSSFIVQAPAGSGKTDLLTQRFLALLARAKEPEEILAITFTRKAAGEMRNRILGYLQRAHDNTPPDSDHEKRSWDLARAALQQDRKNHWNLTNNPARLQVQTIDSLCASLTRQMPLLSSFGTQPAITEDAERLYNEAAHNTLADIESGVDWSPHIEHLLKHLDNNLFRVEQLLAAMLARRDHWLRHIGDRQDERLLRGNLEKSLHNVIEEHLLNLHSSAPGELVGELVTLAAIAADNLAQAGIESPVHTCAGLKKMPGHKVAHLPVWRGLAQLLLTNGNWRKRVDKNIGFPPDNKDNKQRMQALLSDLQGHEKFRDLLAEIVSLPSPVYSESQWDILEALIELLPVAVGHLEVVFGSHGQVDFTEVAQRAVQALGPGDNPTDLALTLDYRFHHILVDEFQDTSLSQYQLLERLTSGWGEPEGRTMFLVGDPMQSIYRFREAEVALYLRARKHGIGQIKLKPLTLSVNFRSQAALVNWFNNAFEKVFPTKEDLTSGAVTYTASEAFHHEIDKPAVDIYPSFNDNPSYEARKIVELVARRRLKRPDESIAILVRAKKHVQLIAREMNQAGIRFRAVEIEHLSDRQPVIDLMSLTRALMHVGDRVAWIAFLRAPWCGLGLSAIEKLIGKDASQFVWQVISANHLAEVLNEPDRARLGRVVAIMSRAMSLRHSVPMSELVEGTWLLLGGPAVLEGKGDLSDCEQFFQLLRSMESNGNPISISSLQSGIDNLYASTDPESDERLQVMTIHKSKGLEFDTVILPGLGRKSASSQSSLLNWAERTLSDDEIDLLLAPISASSEDRDSINTYLHALDRQRELNETSRLLYVAATRARERLYLFGQVKTKIVDEEIVVSPPVPGSLLATLWPAVESEFIKSASEPEAEAGTAESSPGIPWRTVQGIYRLPVDWSSPIGFAPLEQQPKHEAAVEYSWVGPSARHIGTVVHRFMESLTELGLQYREVISSEIGKENIRRELMSLGVAKSDLEKAVATVLEAVERTIQSERGIWILDNRHQDSYCEFALESIEENILSTSIIDRTFVDSDGVRWIIDYKTSSHIGGGREEFLDREVERYESQLNRYASVMQRIESRKIKLGLFFPLLDGWREWNFQSD